jgi:hypothetical protein
VGSGLLFHWHSFTPEFLNSQGYPAKKDCRTLWKIAKHLGKVLVNSGQICPERRSANMVAAMARPSKKTTLKVAQADGEIIAKLAAHRRLSVEALFQEKEVRELFKSLLQEEMERELQRMKGQK